MYLLEKIVRLDYEKLISVGPRSLLGSIGTLLCHFRVDNFEKIPPKDTCQMSQPKIAIGQKTFSLLFTFHEQIRYWGNSVGILSILVFLFILRVPVLSFHRNTEAVRTYRYMYNKCNTCRIGLHSNMS